MAAFPDEQSCIDHFRAIRWRDGESCPHCQGNRIYSFLDRCTFKCGDCRKRFLIKVGRSLRTPNSRSGSGSWPFGSSRTIRRALPAQRSLRISRSLRRQHGSCFTGCATPLVPSPSMPLAGHRRG
ncbi:MAG: transposase [Microvirga sp.]